MTETGSRITAGGRNGSLLLLVLVFLCILAISVLAFNRGAFHSSRMVFRAEQEALARRLLEGAVAETFSLIDAATADPDHAHTRWLIDRAVNTPLTFPLSQLPVMESILAELQGNGMIQVEHLRVTVAKRAGEFRDRVAGSASPYYGQEGHGTLAFNASISLRRGGQPFLAFDLEVHRDFKVICLISRRQPEISREAARNRNLDYVLYVRNGLQEFRQTAGKTLNRSSFGLQVRPKGQGRIYFGGTSQPGDFVFLNVPPERADRLPSSIKDLRTLTFPELEAIAKRILAIDPAIEADLKAAIDSGAIGFHEGVTPLVVLKDALIRYAPHLRSTFLPISPAPASAAAVYAQDGLFEDPAVTGNPKDNTEPGISLLGDGDDPRALIEGGVRQRFLDLVESPGLDGFIRAGLSVLPANASSGFLAALPREAYRRRCVKRAEPLNPLVQAIDETLETLPANPLLTTVSRADDELPYGLNLDTDRKTLPRARTVPETSAPIQFGNLRSYSLASLEEFSQTGFFEGTELKPQGNIHFRSSFTLGEQGPLTCTGRGILSTNGEIVIKSGISCASGAVLILVAGKKVVIETSDPIQAAIVAGTSPDKPTDASVIVAAGKTFRLTGSLWVNRLGSDQWPPGPHLIEYDPARFVRDADLYTVNISPRPIFLRMTAPST